MNAYWDGVGSLHVAPIAVKYTAKRPGATPGLSAQTACQYFDDEIDGTAEAPPPPGDVTTLTVPPKFNQWPKANP